MYRLEQLQQIPISKAEAWAFFSNPQNLKKLTPNDIGFKFAETTPTQMYEGLVVRYTLSPLLGIPIKWASEITKIKEEHYFVDHQLTGPYRCWHHQHFFKTIEGGTELKDIVHYVIPRIPLGGLLHHLVVRKKLNDIFAHRKKSIETLFGTLDKQ